MESGLHCTFVNPGCRMPGEKDPQLKRHPTGDTGSLLASVWKVKSYCSQYWKKSCRGQQLTPELWKLQRGNLLCIRAWAENLIGRQWERDDQPQFIEKFQRENDGKRDRTVTRRERFFRAIWLPSKVFTVSTCFGDTSWLCWNNRWFRTGCLSTAPRPKLWPWER